jgi:hypothetical protein
MVDLADMAGAAHDQTPSLITRVALRIGIGLVLAGESPVCCVGHDGGIDRSDG